MATVTVAEALEHIGQFVQDEGSNRDARMLAVIRAALKPDLVGAAEACEILGIPREQRGNIDRLAGQPPPVADLQMGRVWLRSDIEAWAVQRKSRQRKPNDDDD